MGESAKAKSPRRVIAIVAPLVLFLILGHRYDIDAGEPAMKIDIGATLGTERTQQDVGRFAANRANALGDLTGLGFNHGPNMGRGAGRASVTRC
jgi:hypothetical protein